ncbi:hypothetical protein HPC49_11465 [Pyxidicoccus fallax]|uniref:Lipoprotein n=1 Tax=Pyxidicoccus fallax TaxID=394095 RepID=A0A848LH93_9BACT|nr:hypothetical protein [Pyxidicoccus fallax]NMO17075.1 hypothetical protein [Pyxidicoccus fallax]NPC78857.1 hypothetical protein [Pyxidicoccus fallax]
MRPLTLLLPCLALSGCMLEPDDPVYLSGTVLEADGTPWRGGPLTLMRPRKVNIRLNEYRAEVWDTRYEPWAEVTPGADGLFLHALQARDTGADELERPHPWTDLTSFQLHLPPREDGGRDFLWFQAKFDADLPPLRPWASSLRAEAAEGGVRLSWDAVQPTADIPEPKYFMLLQGEQGIAWVAETRSGEPWVGPELLEDFTDGRARVQAVARGDRTWVQQTMLYNAVSESPPLPLPFAGEVPASRGAPCSVMGDAPLQPCPFTDGKLATLRVPYSGNRLAQEVTVLLPEPVRPRRVVVRGLLGAGPTEVVHAEGSMDGVTWLPLGESPPLPDLYSIPYTDDPATVFDTERFVDVLVPEEAPAVRQVRVWATATFSEAPPPGTQPRASISQLREVSVFAAPDAD